MPDFGIRRLLMVLLVVAAIAGGLLIGGVFVSDDGGDEQPTPPSELAASGELADAETQAVALVEAANAGDCDAVKRLATERVSSQLTGEINCTNPRVDDVAVLDSAVVDDEPVTVSVVLGRDDERLRVDVEMIQDDAGAWRANNFDVAA